MQLEVVKDYYGKRLKSSKDLKTSAVATALNCRLTCSRCSPMSIPRSPPNITAVVVVPAELSGRRVLDLGSGSGRDTYILAQLAGADGEVVGVDMTDEQLATAKVHLDWHRERFGNGRSNAPTSIATAPAGRRQSRSRALRRMPRRRALLERALSLARFGCPTNEQRHVMGTRGTKPTRRWLVPLSFPLWARSVRYANQNAKLLIKCECKCLSFSNALWLQGTSSTSLIPSSFGTSTTGGDSKECHAANMRSVGLHGSQARQKTAIRFFPFK
jgi:Methyltransferase domain